MANKVIPSENSQCPNCEWFEEETDNCPAYPKGIPNRYLTGGNKHDKVMDDQDAPVTYIAKPPTY